MAEIDGIELDRVAGSTAQVGNGPSVYTYAVYIEPSIRVRRRKFAQKIDAILADRRGWIRGGKVSFQRVEGSANTQVILAKPDSVDKLCWPLQTEGEVSCCMGTKVVINLDRWRNAVPHWTGPKATYRIMLVNHEFGHRIGKGHGYCSAPNNLAPVMQQQTYGLQGCRENCWPLASEL